ncbi:potassium-transporting ATPase subunit KdpB [Aliarcobacter cryaerophilus]|uniref:potassium-transporting ATPase subunit KdpB n=1 Tax=Aliarcobacter cryaerophilus TaxID=28198 RepID=UPI000825F4FC|nr:potassium-transporting ATPase subunit KdpB [Aliarcobacter cryaerophilus]
MKEMNYNKQIIKEALKESFVKLLPQKQIKNPIIFLVYLGTIFSLIILISQNLDGKISLFGFEFWIFSWLFFTILFANFAESLAEGRGKAQASALKSNKTNSKARKLLADGSISVVLSSNLRVGDIVVVSVGEIIPSDGEIINGIASIDESSITGESAPVVRESGGDFNSVIGGTKVLSDEITVRIMKNPGETFLDKMISLIEGAKRQKSPNEVALSILLIGLTVIFIFATIALKPMASYLNIEISYISLIALFVCLIPTTIGGLLSAIGISGMDRLLKRNVLAMSGKAIEIAGDVNVLLLDKTGTITYGNRMASELIAIDDRKMEELANASYITSIFDETPEGKSTVSFTQKKFNLIEFNEESTFIPFSAYTRISGVDTNIHKYRKGSIDAIEKFIIENSGTFPNKIKEICNYIGSKGGTPLVVCKDNQVLGAIYLKDIVKPAIKEKFQEFRNMGIKTVMVTGDNPITAAAIAAEAGVDDFVSEATPDTKINLIRSYQKEGYIVAMTGDGTNDAPALAQADVGLAMNSGTQAAKEASNMVDMDNSPTKLMEVIEIGKELLMTRGALTTFSLSNDIAKYFAIIPALFMVSFPQLEALNIMNLSTPQSAILSAVIFNALIIIVLIPLAIKGIGFKSNNAETILRKNILIYGLGGIIVPFIGIKVIDILITTLNIL